jgi:hypothetical protein
MRLEVSLPKMEHVGECERIREVEVDFSPSALVVLPHAAEALIDPVPGPRVPTALLFGHVLGHFPGHVALVFFAAPYPANVNDGALVDRLPLGGQELLFYKTSSE